MYIPFIWITEDSKDLHKLCDKLTNFETSREDILGESETLVSSTENTPIKEIVPLSNDKAKSKRSTTITAKETARQKEILSNIAIATKRAKELFCHSETPRSSSSTSNHKSATKRPREQYTTSDNETPSNPTIATK